MKAIWTRFITDTTGAPAVGASVTVFQSDGITPATIYSTSGGAAKGNPFLTPAGGKAEFYVDAGIYVIQATKDGQTATWSDEEIGMARRDNNLSDLDSTVTARTNLGLKSAAVADIVGTVSESGGIPTGAIIEYGSNANGEYWKFASGLLLMSFAKAQSYTAGVPVDYTLPATLITTADASCSVSVAPDATVDYDYSAWILNTTTIRFQSGTTAGVNTIRFTVVGKWHL